MMIKFLSRQMEKDKQLKVKYACSILKTPIRQEEMG